MSGMKVFEQSIIELIANTTNNADLNHSLFLNAQTVKQAACAHINVSLREGLCVRDGRSCTWLCSATAHYYSWVLGCFWGLGAGLSSPSVLVVLEASGQGSVWHCRWGLMGLASLPRLFLLLYHSFWPLLITLGRWLCSVPGTNSLSVPSLRFFGLWEWPAVWEELLPLYHLIPQSIKICKSVQS